MVYGMMLVQVKWYLNGEEAYSGVTIESGEDFSRITVKHMAADKAGTYKVVAENKVGSAEAEFNVLVKGEQNIYLVIRKFQNSNVYW
jgi:hypothetical protein